MYPSVTQLLVTVLTAQFPTVRFVTELPYALEGDLPAVQLRRFGGGITVTSMDSAYVDVDVWHSTLTDADVLASQIRSWLMTYLPGHSATGPSGTGVFSFIHEQSGMAQRPTNNVAVKRVGGTYTIKVHSH